MQVWADAIRRPAGITQDDILVYEMKPCDVLWNALLMPHRVDASDDPALSLNFSLCGLRCHDKLCRHEQKLLDWQKKEQVSDNIVEQT